MTEYEDPFEQFRKKKEAQHQVEEAEDILDDWLDKGNRPEGEEVERRPEGFVSHRYLPPKLPDEVERPKGFEIHRHAPPEEEEEYEPPKGFTKDRYD